MIAVLLDDHGAALVRSDTHARAPRDRRKGLGGGTHTSQANLFYTRVLCADLGLESSPIVCAFAAARVLKIPDKIAVERKFASL
jgi:hypothetical protein